MTFIFIFLNLLMIFSSHAAAYRYFKKANLSEQLVTTFLIYASQIALSILFLGVVVKNLDILWIILVNGLISLLILYVLRKTIRESIRQTHEKISNFSSEILRAKDFFLYLFLLLFVTFFKALCNSCNWFTSNMPCKREKTIIALHTFESNKCINSYCSICMTQVKRTV